MTALEIGRQRAAQLHNEATAAGRNPNTPYAFACAEAHRRELEVARVPKGDVRLYGGRAVYDPDACLILHEDTGDEFTNAFLVAHEIGHVELGGRAERSTTTEIDLLRPAEAVPLGVGRVVDYNRRQRREVQMDLFAREFLLPRSRLRERHLRGESATDIARNFSAPHSVVVQQLLDALLLPLCDPTPPEDASAKPLLPDQATAASHEGSPFLLEAGPGTGKTHTLVGRVEHLLRRGVDPEKILILTFSNKAAAELSERIAARDAAAAAKIWAGTFHSFGLDIIRRFHDRLGLPPDPRLIDNTDALALLEQEYPKFNLDHFKNLWDPSDAIVTILSAISRASDEVANAESYRAHAAAMLEAAGNPDEKKAAEKCLEVAAVFAVYGERKKAAGCVDFGDLVAMPVRLCEEHPDVREHLRAKYEHILVDEYQDVNRSSVRLLKAIAGEGRNLWVVGDAKQSIYRFRGASSYNMVRFDREDFPGAKRDRLKTNYRSRQELVNTFLTFAAEMPSVRGSDISLLANRGACGERPQYRSVETDDQEVAAVAEAIQAMRDAGFSYSQQAVITSGNERLGRFAEELERLGVPVLYLGSLFERDEIKELLSLLSLLVDGRAMGLVRVGAMPAYAVPLADVALVIAHLKEQESQPLDWVSAIETLSGLSPEGLAGLRRIASLVSGFTQLAQPWEVLTTALLDRSRVAAEIAQTTDVRSRARGVAIWQFLNFLRTQPPASGLPITRLLARIRRLVRYADERDLRQLPTGAQGIDAVRFFTMHGCKGLEFPVVHLPGLTSASIPRSPNSSLARNVVPPDGLIEGATGKSLDALREALTEEQECLFFVALSRARDRLFLYSPTKTSNNRNRPRSPFIDRLATHITSSHVVPTLQLPADTRDTPVPFTIAGTFTVTDHQLALYQRCPRRFLYTHVLEVGGRQMETAFMRMHVAIQKVIEAVTARHGSGTTPAELEALLDGVWDKYGPSEDSYAGEYKRIACELLRYFAGSVDGLETRSTPTLRLPIAGGEIVITPNLVVCDAVGNVAMRQVKSGHKTDKEEEGHAAAAFHLAATSHTPGCRVELVHLGDGTATPVKLTPTVLKNRRSDMESMAAAVRAGGFPLDETPVCPRCPAFFICGQLPAGPLTKNFSA